MPGTKVAVISKSASADTHVAPSEESDKGATKPAPPVEKEVEKPKLKAEEVIKERPRELSTAPSRVSPSEPQLPPKDRERRVNLAMPIMYWLSFITIGIQWIRDLNMQTH